MRLLFIGGTGTISHACVNEAIRVGHEVTIITRGKKKKIFKKKINHLNFDYYRTSLKNIKNKFYEKNFDCVINFLIRNKKQAVRDYKLFQKKTKKYFFISTAACYLRKNNSKLTENSKIRLKTTTYIKNKIKSEVFFLKCFKKKNFPVTIIRPGHIYNYFTFPCAFSSYGYEILYRLINNKPAIIHDRGTNRWTLMHAEDFAFNFIKLINKKNIAGEVFNIASSKSISWINYHKLVFNILNKSNSFIFVKTAKICKFNAGIGNNLKYDQALNTEFNLKKIKKFNKVFKEKINLKEGIRKSINYFQNNKIKIIKKKLNLINKIAKL